MNLGLCVASRQRTETLGLICCVTLGEVLSLSGLQHLQLDTPPIFLKEKSDHFVLTDGESLIHYELEEC